MRSIVWGLGLTLMMAAGVASWEPSIAADAATQPAACPPLKLSDIEDYVDVKAPAAVVRRRINECGLGFTFDKTAEDRLRTLGAQADLIALLASVGRAGLEVRSTPAGAAVAIDGQRRGTTPLTLNDLAPGAHKVMLSFEGYLDNAGEVTLEAGDTERIERTLTRTPAPAGAPSVAPPKGGSKLPWILGGVAVVGGGAALALAGGGGEKTSTVSPTTTTTTIPACVVNVSRSSLSFGVAAGSQQVDVTTTTTNCAWSFTNVPSWLTVSPSSGTNNQTVTFAAQANVADNSSTSQRTASLAVGNQTVSVTQLGLACSYTLELYVNDNPFVGSGATTAGANDRQLILTTSPECRWTGTSSASFLNFRSAPSPISGTGSRARGQLDIRFDANTGGQRQGSITVAGRTINFTQCAPGFRGNAAKTACEPG